MWNNEKTIELDICLDGEAGNICIKGKSSCNTFWDSTCLSMPLKFSLLDFGMLYLVLTSTFSCEIMWHWKKCKPQHQELRLDSPQVFDALLHFFFLICEVNIWHPHFRAIVMPKNHICMAPEILATSKVLFHLKICGGVKEMAQKLRGLSALLEILF